MSKKKYKCGKCDIHIGNYHYLRTKPFDPNFPYIRWQISSSERLEWSITGKELPKANIKHLIALENGN